MKHIIQLDNKRFSWLGQKFPCIVGKNGFTNHKIEGDWKTPTGEFTIESVYYRADRIKKPVTKIPVFEITDNLGWSDDINDPSYNQLVQKPYSYSHEDLYRKDHLYDMILITNYNRINTIKNQGSAIFIHNWYKQTDVMAEFTMGCLATDLNILYKILLECDSKLKWLVDL
jgi:L,D-peptidoglycan transpeptidase YkuD (ErfK/YbiS/YcfS/YnhG family)